MFKNLPVVAAIIAVMLLIAHFYPQLVGEEVSFDHIDYGDRAAVREGRVLYADNCASCHGVNLEGETADWRQRNEDGTLPAPPHDETGHTWHHPDAVLLSVVKYGGRSDSASGFVSNMPAFEEVLSDQEIHDVLAFIKSRWHEDIQQRHDQINQRYKAQ